MAAKRQTRRKARTAKPFEIVDGHELTKAMDADYQRCVEARSRAIAGGDAGHILRLGLEDFLSGYRPSRRIKDQLLDITKEAISISLAIGAMRDYTWYNSDSSIREYGCDLVKKLALELYNASAKVTAIAMNVEAERTTKLQDWLKRDEQLAQIGRGAEVANV